ncbi:MAG: M48 family metalloprotease [Planctomycetaceae bacterium]
MTNWSDVPDQAALIDQLERSNRLAIGWRTVLWLASAAFALAIDWQWVLDQPLYSLLALSLVPSQFLPGLVAMLVKKKKPVEELSEGFRAGVFSKTSLLSTIQETAQSLGIDARAIPFYLTRDKDLNAYAVSIGLSRWMPSIRGVYINRQTLHVSTPSGLKSTIGHELGHLFPYELKWHGGLLAKLTFGGLLALFVLQKAGDPSAFGLIAATGAAWGFLFLDSLPAARMSQPVEFLCDGLGAKASGVEAAISDLLNFGNESQAQYELSIAALKLAGQGKAINDAEAMKIYEDALGYGPTDVDSTLARIQEAVAKEKAAKGEMSIKGLIDFLWRDNVADSHLAQAREEAIALFEMLDKLPRIDWKEITGWHPEAQLEPHRIEALVQELRTHPEMILFAMPTEPRGNVDLSHPSFRMRILYLWKNRAAIESLRPSEAWRH